MKTILIPVFKNRISSRLDCSECFHVVKISENRIKNIEKIKIVTKKQFDRLNSIISIKPDTVICNGITKYFECELLKNKVHVIPWVHGQFEDVVMSFMKGKLTNKGKKCNPLLNKN